MSIVKFDVNQISSIANNLSGTAESVSGANNLVNGVFRVLSVNEWIQNVYDPALLSEIHAASKRLSKQAATLQQLSAAMNSTTQAFSDEDHKRLTCRPANVRAGAIAAGLARALPWRIGEIAALGLSACSIAMPHQKGAFSVLGGSTTGSTVLGKANVSGTVEGDLLGGSYDVSPSSVTGEVHLAKGTVSGNVGLLSGSLSGTVGKAEAKGSIGATIYDEEGNFTPNVRAKVKAEATALEGEAKAQFGNDQYNAHVKATGKVGTAKAEAGVQAGVITVEDANGETHTAYGVEAKAGASAYAASGKVSGGVTIFGVKIDASVSGHAGGAGAEIGGSISTSSASGTIGAGLGLGAGIEVKIDWSDFKFTW